MSGPVPHPITDEQAQKILDMVAEGMPLRRAIKALGEFSVWAFYRWLEADKANTERYTRAKDEQLALMAEEIQEIADDRSQDFQLNSDGIPVLDREHVQRSKLRIDARQWLLSKLKPKVYGDRQTIAGDAENPIPITTIPIRFVGGSKPAALPPPDEEDEDE